MEQANPKHENLCSAFKLNELSPETIWNLKSYEYIHNAEQNYNLKSSNYYFLISSF